MIDCTECNKRMCIYCTEDRKKEGMKEAQVIGDAPVRKIISNMYRSPSQLKCNGNANEFTCFQCLLEKNFDEVMTDFRVFRNLLLLTV